MTGPDIVFSELADGDLPDLIDAIAEIGRETGAHNREIMDLDLWKWQYEDLPTGQSHTYIARHEGRIVGYYHIPAYDFLAGDRHLRIGQIQSVAVSPNFRGQGLFRRLADFAHDAAMADLDLIYTFPNDRSIRTFLKYSDYRTVGALPMYLLALHTAGRRRRLLRRGPERRRSSRHNPSPARPRSVGHRTRHEKAPRHPSFQL